MLPTKRAVLAAVCVIITTISTDGRVDSVGPTGVCDDFTAGRYPDLAWTLEDCLDIWAEFEVSLGRSHHYPEVDLWKDTALELRQRGSPCLLGSIPGGDGVGSTAIRHVATWIFAEEMGCDWLTPEWGKNKGADADGSIKYCHAIVPLEERRSPANTSGVPGMARCTVVNWLSYFQFGKSSASWPSGGSVRVISQLPEKETLLAGIQRAKEEIDLGRTSSKDLIPERVVFQIGMTVGSHHLID
ncbi:unnamed protein product, partial [Scytosiphon promiscuus]